MKVRALVVGEKDAPFEEHEIEIEQGVADSATGEVIKPILQMPG